MTTTTDLTAIWNARWEPLPPGTPIHFIAPDGRVAQGKVFRSQVSRLRGMPALGRQYRAVVQMPDGRQVVPPVLALEGDQEGRAALYQASWKLLHGGAR